MAVPKKKTSKSRRDMRSANKALVKKSNIYFNAEGKPQLSHITLKPKRVRKQKDAENTEA